ncbi:related to transcriptional activator Mut3p [Phialocephala subalpina]|uniref:Related to transcriptional activator Mut3p n=1 Tax=Phialocephala subalpina TaxID=576137 RepID=A0A1L7WMR6_9HELO|nr:related to transcriptional activator Mut3p [Phialocephala subalpina]
MNTARSVRQPISCEPCRRRKIKCSRTRAPCDTCRRRECEERCFYKGSTLRDGASHTNSPSNIELLNRISNLEKLLSQQAGAQIPSASGSMSPISSDPMETRQNFYGQTSQLSPESFASEPSSHHLFSSARPSPRGVGVLNSGPNGTQYEPRSSQWTSVLANTSLSMATPSMADQEDPAASFGFPFTASPVASMEELLSILPPTQQCDILKNRYFAVFSPLFHILHDPTFHAQYTHFVEHPSSAPVSWLAILFILLSLAVTALEEDDPVLRDLARGQDACNNVRVLSRRYREAAMKCLAKQGVFWGKHNVQSLQALIMLVYAMGHSQDHTWVLLGMTHNVAIALGCHIDPSKFNLDPIQCEERRRCWAGLMMLYTIQNTFLGTPDPSWKISYEVQLPADVNDTDISLAGIQENIGSPTQMSYLLFKFRLYDLTAKICGQTFSSSEPSRQAIQHLDQQICHAQETWDSRYLADSTFEALPIHHAVHLHILHAYAHQLFLLLHRPFFAQSILGLDVPNESQIRCIASAEALLDIHRILSETQNFRPYIWYTNGLGSFHAFHAAAVLAVALLMPIYKPQYQKFKRILHETLARFEASAGRSKICEKSARILSFLLASPSPNQTSTVNLFMTQEKNAEQRDDWLGSDQMRLLAERLQPQQWLGPASMAWTEWDSLMTNMEGIRA